MATKKKTVDTTPIAVDPLGVTKGQYSSYQVGTMPKYTSKYDSEANKTYKAIKNYGEYKSDIQPDIDRYRSLVTNPGEFSSKWGDYVDKYGRLLDTEYDPNSDASYLAYKSQYIRGGQKAMQDTLAQAAALTGGYGSSYGQSVAQQTYGDYMAGLADKIPELAQAAQDMYMNKLSAYSNLYGQDWNMYNDNRNYNSNVLGQLLNMDDMYYNRFENGRSNLYNQLNAATDLSNRDYGRFQDEYSRWGTAYGQLTDGGSGGGGGGRSGRSGSSARDDYDLLTELRYANSKGADPYDMWAYAQDQVTGAQDLINQTGKDPAGVIHDIIRAAARRKK